MLKNKIAVVTGGTRGIGYAIVKKFLENNATVVLFGSRKESVDAALESLRAENKNFVVEGFYPNLADEKELQQTYEKIANKFGKIDILVNNAGVSSSTPLLNYTEEDYQKIDEINLKSVFLNSKIVVPYLKQNNGGVILNTSSMVSIYGQPSGCLYPTTKFAVNGLTKSLARELASFGIRVNAVAPGITETDMVKNLPEAMIAPLIKSIPLGRIGTPEDIANAFLFLASDMASYISGVVLSVDGLART